MTDIKKIPAKNQNVGRKNSYQTFLGDFQNTITVKKATTAAFFGDLIKKVAWPCSRVVSGLYCRVVAFLENAYQSLSGYEVPSTNL